MSRGEGKTPPQPSPKGEGVGEGRGMGEGWRSRIVGEGTVAAGELVPHPQNWRRHTREQAARLGGTLAGVGWVQRVIVNRRTGRLLDGHLRAEMARREGAGTPVPVVYVDLSEDEERTVLATLDPIGGMAVADEAALAALVRTIEDGDLRSVAGTMAQTLGVAVEGKGEAVGDVAPQVDRAEELRAKWGVEPGQLWELGAHRLICGDCTDGAVVARVMGGEKADMVFTDPPYGVEFQGKGGDSIEGDISYSLIPLLFADLPEIIAPKCWIYVCGGSSNFSLYARMFDRYFRNWPRVIVWDKGGMTLRHNGYHSCYEFIYYTFTKGSGNLWLGDRAGEAATDIWRIAKPGNDRDHLTEKPVELPARAIRNTCPSNGVVYEPFSGSGSTLLACEALGRRCRAVEIAPGYVAVALERWATATGKTPVLVGG